MFKEFGQDANLQTSLYEQLFSLPFVEDSCELCDFVECVEILYRQLESVGEDLTSQQVEVIILDKLPAWVFEKNLHCQRLWQAFVSHCVQESSA